VDCYYHHAVPSVAACVGCKEPICATCRSAQGDCPGCRLGARIDAAKGGHELPGQVPPRSGPSAPPPPGYGSPPPGYGYPPPGYGSPPPEYGSPPPGYEYGVPPPQYGPSPQPQPAYTANAVATVRPESRALVALSYPFWPLALLALLDGSHSPFVRRQALQALGFNFGVYGLWFALSAIAAIPLIGFSAWPLLPLIVPVAVVASFVYGYKTWQGEDVHVPIVGDFVDNRLAASK
jgi:uncharacterized membrane protein